MNLKAMVHFLDAPSGNPTSWVSLCVSASPNPSSSENAPPTSLWKGEGQVRLDFVHLQVLGVLMIGPTSLKRGRAYFWEVGCSCGRIEMARVKVVAVGWVEDERESTMMQLMWI